MILLIDNYDSFTYNLYHQIAAFYPNIKVVRNNKITLQEIETISPKAIVISPGPKRPEDAGICVEMIQALGPSFPIFGICLGLQALAVAYGGEVIRGPNCVHGKSSKIRHEKKGLFEFVEIPFKVARYHSLIVNKDNLPEQLIIEATSEDNFIMALKHKVYSVYGVQFHPESVLTANGDRIIENFLKIAKVI